MSVWFQGSSEFDCTIDRVRAVVNNPGEYFAGLVGLMPGLTGFSWSTNTAMRSRSERAKDS